MNAPRETSSDYPLRTVVEWREENGDQVVLFACGHRTNFGKGFRPTFEAYPCVQCPADAEKVRAREAG